MSSKNLAAMMPLLTVAIFLLAATSAFSAESGRETLSGHVPSVVAGLTPKGRLPATNNLYLAIGLPLRNQAALDALLQQLYDPASTNYHKFLDPQEFTVRFGPTEADYAAVRAFAESNGLKVAGTHPNRVVLDVAGSVSNVEQAFHITMRTYHHPTEARDFFAPDTEPSVPTNLPVADMWGLSDYALPTPLSHTVDPAKISPLNYNGTGPSGSYQGRDFRNAYAPGASSLVGSGQIAAVAEFDGYYANDITTYEANCGYTNVPLTNILLSVTGTPGYSGQGANAIAEVSLDIELQIAMAPGLSKLMVYEGNNPYTVFNQIATDNTAKQISCSWAWSKGPTYKWAHGSGNYTLDAVLSQMMAQGQSFFQAAGDADADTGSQSVNASTGPIPVDSIYLTSVGGTTLTMSGSGSSWASETVWNWGNNTGSSGGVSSNYTIPSWQTNVSMVANSGSTIYRNFPDVALTADAVEVVYNNGSSAIFGGTSCAAPLWAGFTALVNQQAVAAGGATVGFLNPALYNIAASANYASCFHDIITGNNIGNNMPGLYNAVAGYDLATGLGTPNGTNLINALAPPTLPYFLSQPVSQTATNGATVVFSASAGGQSPLSYQWLCNGTNLPAGGNISGVTSNTLTLSAVTSANAGNYSVIVTNNYGAITSSLATLSVIFPPAFARQPTNQSVLAGSNALFSATVTGASPLAYQWRQNGTNLTNSGNVSGASSNVLALVSVSASNAGNYTLIATNIYGSATSSVATLTVLLPPTITVPPAAQTIQCGSNASFSVIATGTVPLKYQWSLDGAALTAATNTSLLLTNVHLPNHTVAVAVTNLYGSVTSSVPLTVQDTLAPVITLNSTNPFYVQLGRAYVEPGATAYDLCSGAVSVSISGAVNTNAVSTNTVTYSATDGNGNTNIATRTVIVQDTTPPTIVWSFSNLVLAANSNCAAAMPNVTGTNYILATDLSNPLIITQNPTNTAALPLGTNVVVITVADAYGNKSYSTNWIAVRDQTPPAITLNGFNLMTNELGTAFTDPGVTASDACSGIASLTTNGTVNVNVVGTNLLTYAAVDGSGNTNSVTRTVIVQDTTPPTIVWSFTNLVLAANSNCAAAMPNVTGTNYILATDLSGVWAISQSPTNNSLLLLGTNLIVIAVADLYGNMAYSTNQILVQDQTPPVITLNGFNSMTNELGTAFTDPGVTASDTCSGIASLTTNGTVNVNVVGTNLLTYSAVDGSGNTNTATRTVFVRDTTPPTILWSFTNLVLAANTNCSAVMPDVTGTNFIQATDFSSVTAMTQSPTNNAMLPLGTNVVIIAVADPYGNTAYSTNRIVVQDQTPPVITLNGFNPMTNELGAAFTDPGATAYDTCAGSVPVVTTGTVNTNAVGTNTLTYAADDGNGNTNTATRTVIVRDTTPPTILWSFTNLVLAADSNCSAPMPNVTGTNFIIATDLSGALTISQSPTNNAILPLGTNLVVITVKDSSGNAAYSTNTIVVHDQLPPVITMNGSNPVFAELGEAYTDAGATAFDSCAGSVFVGISGVVNTQVVGTNTLTYNATNGSGFASSATRTVIVRDTTPPTILWSFTNLVLAADTNCSAQMPDVTGTNFIRATDLSGPLTISQSPTNSSILLVGTTNSVVITIQDAFGNAAYSTNTVTVKDQTPPVITLNGSNPVFVELGQTFTDPGATAYDFCAGPVPVVVIGTVNTSVIGTNTLTYIADDGNGNTNTAMRTVIVRDTTPPTILWSFTNLVLAADTNCSAVMPDVTGTNFIRATDLSDPLTISQSPTNGAVLLVGTNLVVFGVSDVFSNTAYSTNAVIILDQTPPVISRQPESQTNNAGETVNFSVAASACTPLTFQWYFNNAPLLAQTNAILTLSNLTTAVGGNYFIVVTASGGSSTSSVAGLTVNLLGSSLTLASPENPSGFKDGLRFIATVLPAGATGTIRFYTNGEAFDLETLVAGLAMSTNIFLLPRVTNIIAAVYSGDANDLSSTNLLLQVVTNHPPVAASAYYTNAASFSLNIPIADLATNWSDVDGDTISLADVSVSTNGISLTNTGTALIYFSTNNVADQFTCTIADGFGGTNFQTVFIAPMPVSTTPLIIGVGSNPGGSFDLTLAGAPGYTYVLETTTNLISFTNWLPVATNTLGTNGVWQFSDEQATNFVQRFYRLKLAP